MSNINDDIRTVQDSQQQPLVTKERFISVWNQSGNAQKLTNSPGLNKTVTSEGNVLQRLSASLLGR